MMHLCLLICSLWGLTMGVPSTLTSDSNQTIPAPLHQQLTPVETIIKRDYNETPDPYAPVPMVAEDAGNAGYSEGNMVAGYSGGGTDVGQYYYYYPVEKEETTTEKPMMSAQDHVLYTPVIIIIMLLVMILLQMTLPGLIASLAPLFPAVSLEGLEIPWPSGLLPAVVIEGFTVPDPNGGRGFNDTQFLSWEKLNKLTTSVRSAIESDECLPRLVCYSAHYADASKILLMLLEDMPSKGYLSYVKIFQDSALRKTDCNKYKCGTFGHKD